MVAISLYRGNLHRVPEVPRRWPMPAPRISRRDFKRLADKRAKALARSQPNMKKEEEAEEEEGMGDNGCSKQQNQQPVGGREEAKEPRSELPPVSDSIPAGPEPGGDPGVSKNSRPQEMPVALIDPQIEVSNGLNVLGDKEKRKRYLEEKLSKLNDNKHNLVQILKQVIKVEEELKKRSSIHVLGVRPAAPQLGEATVDSGLITRHSVPKLISEANFGGDLEGGESEDGSNHNTQARHLQPMRSTSPTAASPLGRPPHSSLQYNTVPHATRVAGHAQTTSNLLVGVTASPSRFAPPGHHGQAGNPPSLSVSGTHFIASSPSPAASGGTSAFRDTRLTSPSWN